MSTEVICALISLGGVIISSGGALCLVNWRLGQLEKKVDEHNGWGEKFSAQSTDIALMKQDLNYIKKTMEKLERKIDT